MILQTSTNSRANFSTNTPCKTFRAVCASGALYIISLTLLVLALAKHLVEEVDIAGALPMMDNRRSMLM
jgi:hypothetical protein